MRTTRLLHSDNKIEAARDIDTFDKLYRLSENIAAISGRVLMVDVYDGPLDCALCGRTNSKGFSTNRAHLECLFMKQIHNTV